MNKQTFKALRSKFRKISRDAYISGDRESFVKRVHEGEKSFREEIPTEFNFKWFDKPTNRQQVVSMRVFSYLDYPFDRISEPKFN